MKAISVIFGNSITRNLALIFVFGFMTAVGIVAAGVILLNHLLAQF